jgi:hypothetical protein
MSYGTCTLFVAEEKYTELVKVFQTKVHVHSNFEPNNFPLCDCDEVCSIWVSRLSTAYRKGS